MHRDSKIWLWVDIFTITCHYYSSVPEYIAYVTDRDCPLIWKLVEYTFDQ